MENLTEILEILVKTVLIPAIPIVMGFAVNALKKWAESKVVEIENANISSYLLEITEVISQAVISTTQTYVDSLKAQGKFDAEAQRVAFEMTKTTVLALLAEDAKEFIADMYGDMNLWLDTKIEQMVKETKLM